ncbi:hypothetical protein L596_002380 [Steinernema carpocapsae]|uniref:JmjN domain-containing protein n=1 Tax=Steinernema carpocapsae TaxID=34508 RepID=A0A4U8UQY0_STECR|nr:hypothetical protein L596_002380 [Steinernema carpocapsae]
MQLFKEFGRTIHWVEQSKAHLVSGVAKIIPPLEWNPRPIRKKDYSSHDLDKLRSKTEETATTFDRIVFDKGNATIDALERDEDPNPKSLTLGKSKSISTVKSFRRAV